jgi:hypothetical protein
VSLPQVLVAVCIALQGVVLGVAYVAAESSVALWLVVVPIELVAFGALWMASEPERVQRWLASDR